VGRVIEDGDGVLTPLATEVSDRTRSILRGAATALHGAEKSASDVFVGGTSQLASLWEDLAHVHSLLSLLERDTQLRTMLDTEGGGTSVRIGAELPVDETDIAVVSTTYDAGERGAGRVGVIGPMRMDYRRTIKLVEEVGEGLGDSLGR
jgi:heat-inducible transcriptional repressor